MLKKLGIILVIIEFLCACILTCQTAAQTTADNKSEEIKCDKMELKIGLGLDALRGNSDEIKISSDTTASWQLLREDYRRIEFKFSNSFLYSLSNDVLNANKLNMEMLVYYYLRDLGSFFVFTRPSYNEKIKLDYRLESGIGAKIDVLQHVASDDCENKSNKDISKSAADNKECCDCRWKKINDDELSLSVAILWDTYQYSYETELKEVNKIDEEVFRLSIRPKISYTLFDKFKVKAQVFLQPALNDVENDLRILVKSEINYDLSSSLTYVFKIDGEYNSYFPDELNIANRWDWTITNNIRLNLK